MNNGHLRTNPTTEQIEVWIPKNELGITEGWNDIVSYLRQHKTEQPNVQFIADMIEV